jgi:hypothetical protein
MRRRVRRVLTWVWFRLFLLFERFGVHILPKYFYTPIADYHWLQRNKEVWIQRAPLAGIEWNVDKQFEWLQQICKPYYHEVAGLKAYREAVAEEWGPGFGPINSQVLHCFIRTMAPPQIVEIGSGISTACMLHASRLNEKAGRPPSRITCIEPYPRRAFYRIGNVTHIQRLCQAVPQSVFAQLQSADLLFVDSSHAVKVGSDVIRIYLDIIPRLPRGVFIYIDDINLPYAYSRYVLSERFFSASQETALLLALLTNNEHLSVLACLSALHYDRAQELMELLSDYRPQANLEGLYRPSPPTANFVDSIFLQTR